MTGTVSASYVSLPAGKGRWWGNRKLIPLLAPVDELHEDPDNLRTHTAYNLRVIASSLREHGQQGIALARPDGTMVGGSGTLRAVTEAMYELQWTHLATLVFEGTEAEAELLAMRLNRTADVAEWDFERLGAKLGVWRDAGLEMDDLGWRSYEVTALADATFTEDIGEMPDTPGMVRSIKVTEEQRELFNRVWNVMREGDDGIKEGQVVDRLCRDWLDIHVRSDVELTA